MRIDLSKIGTEKRNKNTMNIDTLETLDMVKLINKEDQAVIDAIENITSDIAVAVDAIVLSLSNGGRLVYIGAGTSGRLGVLDASECLPTFGVGEEAVVGIIAGGDHALRHPIESAEDSLNSAQFDLEQIDFNENDILCAIASSGRTPYCVGGLDYAKSVGAKTIALACVSNSVIGQHADYPIEAVVGQEVITGSTRMKSGSAQKMVLNILSTGSMVKLGKVYGNLMVDVKPTNEKLMERAYSIIMDASDCDYDRAKELLILSEQNVKTAIVMELCGLDKKGAETLLDENKGHVARSLKSVKNKGG